MAILPYVRYLFQNIIWNILNISYKGFNDLTLPFLNPKSVKLMASLYLNFLTSMKHISKLPGHKSKNTICRGMHILVKGFLLAYFFFQRCFDNVVHHFTIESKTKILTKCANTIQNTCHCMCSVLELETRKKGTDLS